MDTARKYFSVVMTFVCWACAGSVPSEVVSDADYSVYSATLEQLFLVGFGGPPSLDDVEQVRPGEIVLLSPTIVSSHDAVALSGGVDIDLEEELDRALEFLRNAWPHLEPTTVDNYRRKNTSRAQVEAEFELRVPITIIQEESVGHIFSPRGGWHAFYSRHPTAPGLIRVSRVGFNELQTQALLHIENQRQSMYGGGQFVLLTKAGGTWKVATRLENWVS